MTFVSLWLISITQKLYMTKKSISKRRSSRGPRSHSRSKVRPSTRRGFSARGSGFRGRKRTSGGKGRKYGKRIDYSLFVKKAEYVEEKPYVNIHKFSDFPFSERLQQNIAKYGYVDPRPIQDQSISHIIEGKDIFGMANTGTGKTAAFLLPLIEKVYQKKEGGVLIMAPTRELAMQIEEDLRSLSFGMGIFSVACVGGLPIMKQIREIRRGVSFIIGTPGRIRDLMKRNELDLSTCHSVVLDEADRMLDMGFVDDMEFIINKTAEDRQSLFFSATLTPEIKNLTSKFLKNPVFISVIKGSTSKNIDQDVIRTKTPEEKIEKLHEILQHDASEKVLIFRERKHHVDSLTKDLAKSGFKVGCIHGDKRSRERIRTLESFKKDQIDILIATDVAARGLDIPDVTHVINFDIPESYETYVHRIGRTGRSGKKGTALTFI